MLRAHVTPLRTPTALIVVLDACVACRSNSANRACCASYERGFCPWEAISKTDSGYCAEACSPSQPDRALCRQLAAGCGVNILTARYEWFPSGPKQCTWDSIAGGTCAICKQPQWCNDPASADFAFGSKASTADGFMNLFLNKPWPQTRCGLSLTFITIRDALTYLVRVAFSVCDRLASHLPPHLREHLYHVCGTVCVLFELASPIMHCPLRPRCAGSASTSDRSAISL